MGLVRRTASSHRDYGDIWDFVALHGNPDVADKLLLTFDEKLKLLSDFPGAGQARPEIRPRYGVSRSAITCCSTDRSGAELNWCACCTGAET